MKKLFFLLSAAIILMIFVTGIGIFWLANNEIAKATDESVESEAKIVALNLSAEIDLLSKTLDKMAQDPDVLNAVKLGNPALLKVIATNLEKHIPNILKIRLLLPDNDKLDDQSLPRMGFADLEMVKETFTHNPYPSIHGEKGADRHLAIARGITENGKVLGVILASFDENVVLRNLPLAGIKNSYLEIKQGEMLLGKLGNKEGSEKSEENKLNISNTDWIISYRTPSEVDFSNLTLTLVIFFTPAFIASLCLFVGYRWLSNQIRQDLESLMKTFKDIMTHNSQASYPVELAEMAAAVSNLMQFKRILDYSDRDKDRDSTMFDEDTEGDSNIIVSDDDDFDLEGLFDESTDMKF